jgi:O-antigen/teichoic acid export membrane protein
VLSLARGRLSRQSIGTLAIAVGALGAALLISIVFARLIGAEGFGAYALAYAWVQILLIPAKLGADTLMLREVARFNELEPGRIRPYVGWSSRALFLTVGASVLVGGGLILLVHQLQRPEVVTVQLVAFALVPLMAFTNVWQAVLRGLGRIFLGQIPLALLGPTVVLAGAGLFWLSSAELTPIGAIGLRIASLVAAALVLGFMLLRLLPAGDGGGIVQSDRRSLSRALLTLGFIGALATLATRTDIVMLGFFSDLEEVAAYTVASRGASFIRFPQMGLNLVIAPVIAAAYAAGRQERLQSVLTWGTRSAMAAALPIGLALIFVGNLYLDLFGEGFGDALGALRILSVGTLLTTIAGFLGALIMMTGHEAVSAKLFTGILFLNIVLNWVLIPAFGAEGAAVATAVSTNLGTAILVVWSWRKLRLDPTVIGRKADTSR